LRVEISIVGKGKTIVGGEETMMVDSMDAARIVDYFKGKCILVTGSTGFLGKSMCSFYTYSIYISTSSSVTSAKIQYTFIFISICMPDAVLVEKILRVQPDVHKIYLVVRAIDEASAKQRVQQEVHGRAGAHIHTITYAS